MMGGDACVGGGTGPERVLVSSLQDSALSVQVTVFGRRQGRGRRWLLVYSKLRDPSSTQPFERHRRV